MTRERLFARLKARVGTLALELEIDTGPGTLAVVGPNGSGKTSLLSLLLGIAPADRGVIKIGDTTLLDTEAGESMPIEQRRLGYVPQDYGLFPHLSVHENIVFALSSAFPRLSRSDLRGKVEALLSELDLQIHASRYPQTLSGGEKQRVALARAISVQPRALLLDEPMAALDVLSRREVVAYLSDYLRTLSLPTVVVTHDALEAQLLGHRIAVLEDGHITQCGTWEELTARPASPFVERFVESAEPLRLRADRARTSL